MVGCVDMGGDGVVTGVVSTGARLVLGNRGGQWRRWTLVDGGSDRMVVTMCARCRYFRKLFLAIDLANPAVPSFVTAARRPCAPLVLE